MVFFQVEKLADDVELLWRKVGDEVRGTTDKVNLRHTFKLT